MYISNFELLTKRFWFRKTIDQHKKLRALESRFATVARFETAILLA